MKSESLEMLAVDGAQIVCRAIGKGPPLLVLNGFAATSADWDPSFIHGLAFPNQLILLNNRGIGDSTDESSHLTLRSLPTMPRM
jgi:pimeloyl-ACP methyl ester carboxylesterase